MPDGPACPCRCSSGAERIGAVVVGIGFRAGIREIKHLVARTGASVIVTEDGSRDELATDSGRNCGD